MDLDTKQRLRPLRRLLRKIEWLVEIGRGDPQVIELQGLLRRVISSIKRDAEVPPTILERVLELGQQREDRT
jgi:hypothetical protein